MRRVSEFSIIVAVVFVIIVCLVLVLIQLSGVVSFQALVAWGAVRVVHDKFAASEDGLGIVVAECCKISRMFSVFFTGKGKGFISTLWSKSFRPLYSRQRHS